MSTYRKFFSGAILVATVFTGYADDTMAQEITSFPGGRTASVTYGPYARATFGGSLMELDGTDWLPSGPSDPRISFDTSADDTFLGSIALGYDWQNGTRADLSFFATGTREVSGPCSGASDVSPCSDHAEITDASVSTKGAMGNFFYAPLEDRGSHAIFQPFVSAGVGIADNEAGAWTRENPASPRQVRTFSCDRSSSFSWSVGIVAECRQPGLQQHPRCRNAHASN